jgi:Holliday junction resolvase RusA-like endonuclease
MSNRSSSGMAAATRTGRLKKMSRILVLSSREARLLGLDRNLKRKRKPSVSRRLKPALREEEIEAKRLGDGEIFLRIPAAPRPKKNSTRVVWTKRGPIQVQRQSYYRFVAAVMCCAAKVKRDVQFPITWGKCHINAQFYCDNDRSDLINLEQGLADALEKAGILENDRQLVSWDGSRHHVDKRMPRVEITCRQLG